MKQENTHIKDGTEYFYLVEEFVTTFEADPGKNDSISNTVLFKNTDLQIAQKEAIKFYLERLMGFNKYGRYFLPFASAKNFKKGENAAFSISVHLIEKPVYNIELDFSDLSIKFEEYTVLGEEFDEMQISWEVEESLGLQNSMLIEGFVKNELFTGLINNN